MFLFLRRARGKGGVVLLSDIDKYTVPWDGWFEL